MNSRRFGLAVPDLSRWREGNTGVEGVWRFESGRPGREVLVSALVHGNELCGAHVLAELLAAGVRPSTGALTLMLANLAAFDRFDPDAPDASRYVDADLNRLWGDMPWRKSDPAGWSSEQRRAHELAPFVERSQWLLDLHSMHEAGPPLGLVGPFDHHAVQAVALGAPQLLVSDAGHAAGRRMRDHGPFGDAANIGHFALLVECGFHGDHASLLAARRVTGRFLVASGALASDSLPAAWPPDSHAEPEAEQKLLEVTHAITVKAGEPPRLVAPWVCGQRIEQAHTLIGWTGGKEVRTPYERCVLVMPTLVHAVPGATLVRFARESGATPLHCGAT